MESGKCTTIFTSALCLSQWANSLSISTHCTSGMLPTRLSYDTDLTDDQWQILEPLVPAATPGGRPRSLEMREVLNAIFYLHSQRN
jgi:hypothetical protein